MASRNLYLTYKRDTARLLYWIVNTSNGIVRSAAHAEDHATVTINTTGHSTVSELVQMSNLIAKHLQPIPSEIFRLFRSVIKARSITYDAFRQIINEKPDPEIDRSNATHRHFIEALTEAFQALGGGSTHIEDEEDGELDDSAFVNQFTALRVSGGSDDDDDDDEDDKIDAPAETESTARAKVQRKSMKGKGKKRKRAQKSRNKPPPKATPEASLADIPIESYRIIEDTEGLVSEYLLAVYAVTIEWSELRSYIQGLWREVAYDGLNSAVAASLTNIAVGMVKQTSSAVFVDFPGHDSYETIMKTLTRGDPEWAQGNFGVALHRVSADGRHEKVKDTSVDIKEQIWIHTYYTLVEFLNDFQKTRSGKPTKAMQAQIGNWDPRLDLQRATSDERLRWRRAYTINWLYDLVNLFSSVVVQRNTLKGEHHDYETVDWSSSGPWHQHRRLFGLNEFAGAITTLAMQKQNTDVRQKILPHHVFQLQCVVDSLAASRGWTVSTLHGHVLGPPACEFRPRRDVDLFLDRECQRTGQGFLQAVDILTQLLDQDAKSHSHPNRHEGFSDILGELKDDFINWLGESKYMYGLNTIPPSRFSKHNANGLWEYSPLLCAAGLVEGLVLSQRISMMMWDRMTEPTLIIHLHNYLVQKGYIKEPIGLYAVIQDLFKESFFPEGVPESGSYDALVQRAQGLKHRTSLQKQRSNMAQTNDVHRMMDINLNYFFNTKSALLKYYDAEWVPERIPDREITFSVLGMLRLSETKQVLDTTTGEKCLEATGLVKRFRAAGMAEAELIKMASIVLDQEKEDIPDAGTIPAMAAIYSQGKYKDYKHGFAANPFAHRKNKMKTGKTLLDLLRLDLFADVCGMKPVSSINYILVTVHFLLVFGRIEDRLRELRNPLYVQMYEQAPPGMRRTRRAALVIAAMAEEDPDTLRICAEVLQDPRMGVIPFIYWEDLHERETGFKGQADPDEVGSDACSVM